MTARDLPALGYYALKTEILGCDRILDVFFDSAPPEKGCDYPGYFNVTKVSFNGVDLTPALTKEDLEAIAEEAKDGLRRAA